MLCTKRKLGDTFFVVTNAMEIGNWIELFTRNRKWIRSNVWDECVRNGWEQTLPEIANGTWKLPIFYYYHHIHDSHTRIRYLFWTPSIVRQPRPIQFQTRTTTNERTTTTAAASCYDSIKTHAELTQKIWWCRKCDGAQAHARVHVKPFQWSSIARH